MRPRQLNLASPSGQDIYELHLDVKSKIGVLRKITGFLAEANVDILSMHIQSTKGKAADVVAYLGMGESEMRVEELLNQVRELDFVQEAEVVKKDRVVFEEFLFPILMDEGVRGFLMTDSAWMSIATRLVLTYGTDGLAILHEAGVACGEEYARSLRNRLGPRASAEAAVENLMVMLRAAGMGISEMTRTPEGFLVKVRDPIVSPTETKIPDHFLTGVIAGAAGQLFATSFSVDNVRFEGGELRFALGGGLAVGVAEQPAIPMADKAR